MLSLVEIKKFIEKNTEVETSDRLSRYIEMTYTIADEAFLADNIEELAVEERDAYVGQWDSTAQFAEEMAHELGIIGSDDVTTFLVIDWEATWDSTFRFDYETDGHNFWRNV